MVSLGGKQLPVLLIDGVDDTVLRCAIAHVCNVSFGLGYIGACDYSSIRINTEKL